MEGKKVGQSRLIAVAGIFMGCRGFVLEKEGVVDTVRKAGRGLVCEKKLYFHRTDDGGMSISGLYRDVGFILWTTADRTVSITLSLSLLGKEPATQAAHDFLDALRDEFKPVDLSYQQTHWE